MAWVEKDVPELRIIDDEPWQAARARQAEIARTFANVTEGVREHHRQNRLNGTRRPSSLLSGLITCGCCGGPYSLRGKDRFACSNHVGKGTCDNKRTILRTDLEERVLAGLRDRLMAPEVVEEAMRSYAQEINRMNRERRPLADGWNVELARIEKQIAQIVEAIADGMYHASMKDRLTGLENRKTELASLLVDVPVHKLKLLPNAAAIYAEKIGKLAEVLKRPEDRAEAA